MLQKGFNHHPCQIIDKSLLQGFFEALSPNLSTFQNVRMGSVGDGGYVIPKIEYQHVISVGIGDNLEFESQLSNLNPSCMFTLVDSTIKELPDHTIRRFKYVSKLCRGFSSLDEGYVSLNELVADNFKGAPGARLLKIDIEGWEYESLSSVSTESFEDIDILVIEFHNLFALRFNYNFKWTFGPLFARLFEIFEVTWVNAHNGQGYVFIHGELLPNLLEITLCKKSSDPPSESLRIWNQNRLMELTTIHDIEKPAILYQDQRFTINKHFSIG